MNTRKRTNEEIYSQAVKVLPGGVSRNTIYRKPHPSYADKANGCYVTDMDGIERVDFANNMASLIHGHAHPAIVNAVIEQLYKGTAYTFGTESEVLFAQHLCDRVPSFDKIRFVNSGTEAVMAMIKASRAFTGRPKIAKSEGAYHGTYDFAEVSHNVNPFNWGDEQNPNSVPLCYGTPKGVLDNVVIYHYNEIEKTLNILDKHKEEIAAVLIDPVSHRAGLMEANKDFVEAIYKWTRQNGALLAFDEVITFRVGYSGAQENYSVKPDITAMGKIIGGGFPVGAFAGREDVMKVFDPSEPKLLFPHSGTFSANPITMTAGRVAMELFDKAAVTKLNALTMTARKQIEQAITAVDVPVSITGAGSMFRLHLSASVPKSYREAYQDKETLRILNTLIDHLYYKEKIIMVNTCACMFSTVITQKEVDMLTEGMYNGLKLIKPELEKLHDNAQVKK